MSAPTFTGGSAGNLRASASLAASAVSTTYDLDVSTDLEARVQSGATFGTIAATAGLQVDIYELIGSTPVADTTSRGYTEAAVSGARATTVHLPTGKWRFKYTNLDATNGLTLVYATFDLTPAVA